MIKVPESELIKLVYEESPPQDSRDQGDSQDNIENLFKQETQSDGSDSSEDSQADESEPDNSPSPSNDDSASDDDSSQGDSGEDESSPADSSPSDGDDDDGSEPPPAESSTEGADNQDDSADDDGDDDSQGDDGSDGDVNEELSEDIIQAFKSSTAYDTAADQLEGVVKSVLPHLSVRQTNAMPIRNTGLLRMGELMFRGSKQRLKQLLEEQQASRVQMSQKRGKKLTGKHLYRTGFQDTPLVWQRTLDGKNVNTCVYISLDCSGSMDYSDREQVFMFAYGLAKLLKELKVACKIVGYSADGDIFEETVFKDWGEDISDRKAISRSGSSTPTAEALHRAKYDLLDRPEPRKLIVQLTDGQANSPANVKAIMQTLPDCGIGAMCVGYAHKSYQKLFDEQYGRHVLVTQQMQTVAVEFIKVLKGVLQ